MVNNHVVYLYIHILEILFSMNEINVNLELKDTNFRSRGIELEDLTSSLRVKEVLVVF